MAIDKRDMIALVSAGGASLIPLFVQSWISPFGPIGIFVFSLIFGYGAYRLFDKAGFV